MAHTESAAPGRIELLYTAYGKPHVCRFWTRAFEGDSGVGTFVAPSTPASLDALATALTVEIAKLYATAASLAWGAWRGLRTQGIDGEFIVGVEGTITPGTQTFQSDAGNAGAVGQVTYSWRDADGRRVKGTYLGAVYQSPIPFVYSSLSSTYKSLSDYVTGSSVIVSRAGVGVDTLIDVTFDTNDGLTRRYRR